MTLYEINQSAYNNLPKMTKAEIEKTINQDYVFGDIYYMLLCRELNDYTVFNTERATNKDIWNTVLDILKTRGTLKGIELKEDQSIEFWVTNGENTNMYLLFPYDWGVINVEQ